jgi:B12-binding domain/radical SAM domain protein
MGRADLTQSAPAAYDGTPMAKAALILNDARTGRIAFHVLLGALDESPVGREIDVLVARSRAEALELIERCRVERARFAVAFSFYSADFENAWDDLRSFRAVHPGILSIAGGVHATAEPESVLRAGFDYAAIGEGEMTILEIAATLASGGDLGGIPGLSRLDGGKLTNRAGGPRIELDDFPSFAARRGRLGPIEITRGCVYACQFCQTPFMFKAKFRHRSIESIQKHVSQMRDRGAHDIRFMTPTALSYGSDDERVRLDAVAALLRGVREAAGPEGRIFFGTFPSEVRPEHVSAEALELLKPHVANDNLVIGGQSGSDRVLEAMRRGHRAADVERAAALAVAHGFTPNVDFIFGFPGETSEDVDLTVALAEKIVACGGRIHAHAFMPLPGTPLRRAEPSEWLWRAAERLRRLEGRGKFYGQWKRQAGMNGLSRSPS